MLREQSSIFNISRKVVSLGGGSGVDYRTTYDGLRGAKRSPLHLGERLCPRRLGDKPKHHIFLYALSCM